MSIFVFHVGEEFSHEKKLYPAGFYHTKNVEWMRANQGFAKMVKVLEDDEPNEFESTDFDAELVVEIASTPVDDEPGLDEVSKKIEELENSLEEESEETVEEKPEAPPITPPTSEEESEEITEEDLEDEIEEEATEEEATEDEDVADPTSAEITEKDITEHLQE